MKRSSFILLLAFTLGTTLDSEIFLATFGVSGEEGVQEDWLGVPMFFASLTAEETTALLEGAGFGLVRTEVVTEDEGEDGLATFLWTLGRLRR